MAKKKVQPSTNIALSLKQILGTVKHTWLPLDQLFEVPWNPKSRTDLTKNKILSDTADSIMEFGVFQDPVVKKVGSKYLICDGMGRVTILRQIASSPKDRIRVALTTSKLQPAEIFEMLNRLQKKIKSNEQIEVWLNNPVAVPRKIRCKLEHYEKLFGRSALENLAKRKAAPYRCTVSLACQKFLGWPRKAVILNKILDWMIAHDSTDDTRHAIKQIQNKRIIANAISKNISLRVNYS